MKVVIPGLDHEKLEDGRWLRTAPPGPRLKDYLDPKNLSKKRKLEKQSAANPAQGVLWG